MKTEMIKRNKEIIETMTKQMASCGIHEGYLDVRGLELVTTHPEELTLHLHFKKIIITLKYNEGRDCYEVMVTNKKTLDITYNNEYVMCEEWKEVFDEIWRKNE